MDTQCYIRNSICIAHPKLPFPTLMCIFLSILHYITNQLDTNACIIPNQIHASDCLAHILHHDLCCPQLLSAHMYLEQFRITLCILNNLEQLREPHITANKQITIFLFSFPLHTVTQFTTALPSDSLTLDIIADVMQELLDGRSTTHPTFPWGPVPSLPSLDPLNYQSDEQEPLLPIGPICYAKTSPVIPFALVASWPA